MARVSKPAGPFWDRRAWSVADIGAPVRANLSCAPLGFFGSPPFPHGLRMGRILAPVCG